MSLSGEIKEWFEYDGQPYRFKVLADISNKTEISINKLISLINDYKNERSWLEELSIEATVGNDLHISAGCVRETSFNSFFSINTSINVKPTAVVNLRL